MIIFGKDEIFRSSNDVKNVIDVLKYYREKIQQPQIIDVNRAHDLLGYFLVAEDTRRIGPHMLDWLYKEEKARAEKSNYLEILLACSIEDKEWTKERNKDLAYTAYRKITFLPEIQRKLKEKIGEYLVELDEELVYRVEMEEAKKKAREKRFNKWTKANIYEYIEPKGGEDGHWGYLDADYVSNETGAVVRMVNRSVFDVGCDWYPKRLEQTKDAFNKTVWTDDEFSLGEWMREFADFRGIRM